MSELCGRAERRIAGLVTRAANTAGVSALASAGAPYAPILLAAGRGQRLGGRGKALVQLAGRSFLERCLDTYRTAATRVHLTAPVVVIGRGDTQIEAHLGALGMEFRNGAGPPHLVTNPDPDRGQTSSLQCGLAAVTGSVAGLLIWPIDHPLVEPGDLVALVEAARKAPDAPVVLPSHGGRAGHPALVAASLVEEILALDPRAPLHAVLRPRRPETVFVERAGPGVVLDLDTPEDLDRATALLADPPAAIP